MRHAKSVTNKTSQTNSTEGSEYAERLNRLEFARWKQLLDVQRPYRWNLQRLKLGRVLDVGCGIGRNLVALPGAVGVDHNAESIATAKERGLNAFTTEEWQNSSDQYAEEFDTLLLAHVLEHMSQPVAHELLLEYLPFLKPKSRVLFICPQEKGYVTDSTHVRFVDLSGMADHARAIGFTPLRGYSFPFPRSFGKVFPYNEFVLVAGRW